MVRLMDKKIVMEIDDPFPAAKWADMMRDLLHCIAIADKERVDNCSDCIYGVCELLEAMLPNEEDLRKLLPGE